MTNADIKYTVSPFGFSTLPKPVTRAFTLVPNCQPAVIGRYSFQMRTAHPESSRTQHQIKVTLTRTDSGQDHCQLTWEHKKTGIPNVCMVSFAHLLDPGRQAGPHGPTLYTHGSFDLEAPWWTSKGKPRQGNHFYIDVLPVYRVGPDPVAEDAAEIRKAAATFSETLRAIAARSA